MRMRGLRAAYTDVAFYASLALMKCRKFRLEETRRGVECTHCLGAFPSRVFSSRASYSLIGNTTWEVCPLLLFVRRIKGREESCG